MVSGNDVSREGCSSRPGSARCPFFIFRATREIEIAAAAGARLAEAGARLAEARAGKPPATSVLAGAARAASAMAALTRSG